MKLKNPLPRAKLKKYPFGNIHQFFGENPLLYGRLGLQGHNGIDITTFEGDVVYSAHEGIATTYYNSNLGGQVVSIKGKSVDNEPVQTVYGHLRKEVLIKNGDYIWSGRPIGEQSNTGFVISGNTPYWGNAPAGKGVHLHFGVYPLNENQTLKYPNNGYKGAVPPLLCITDDYSETITLLDNLKEILQRMLLLIKGRIINN